MKTEQFEALNTKDPNVVDRLKTTSIGDIIYTEEQFDTLCKDNPNLPSYLFPQSRKLATDPDHVDELYDDFVDRMSRFESRTQTTPISAYGFKAKVRDNSGKLVMKWIYILCDGNHRIRAALKAGLSTVWLYELDLPSGPLQATINQTLANKRNKKEKNRELEDMVSQFSYLLECANNGTLKKGEFISNPNLCPDDYLNIFNFKKNLKSMGYDKISNIIKPIIGKIFDVSSQIAGGILRGSVEYDHVNVSENYDAETALEAYVASDKAKKLGFKKENIHSKVAYVAEGEKIIKIALPCIHRNYAIDVYDKAVRLLKNHTERHTGCSKFNGLWVDKDVKFYFTFGLKYGIEDSSKDPVELLWNHRSRTIWELKDKYDFETKTCGNQSPLVSFESITFLSQLRGTESGCFTVSPTTLGIFPSRKNGVYNSKDISEGHANYKGF